MMFSSQDLSEISDVLNQSDSVVILTHYNPDGDAIGSSLALYHYLKNMGKKPTVIVPNYFPYFLHWLPESQNILVAEDDMALARTSILQASVLFLLDCNHPGRVDSLEKYFNESQAVKILIDHHEQPDSNFKFMYSDTSEPATAQMMYSFFSQWNALQFWDKQIADCIYTGIFTDTGGFRFPKTTAHTHRILAHCLDTGTEPSEVAHHILDSNSPQKIKLLGKYLRNLKVYKEYATSISFLTKKDLKPNDVQKGDTEGFVNYGLSMEGVKLTIFIKEDIYKNFIKLSFRSFGTFDCNTFARKYFNGGGHKNAAGGRSEEPLQKTIEKIENLFEIYADEIKNS